MPVQSPGKQERWKLYEMGTEADKPRNYGRLKKRSFQELYGERGALFKVTDMYVQPGATNIG